MTGYPAIAGTDSTASVSFGAPPRDYPEAERRRWSR